jgi:predicted nuclease of restriction endonuclease-like (RecB) superfamily
VVPQLRPARQGEGVRRAHLVHAAGNRARLEPQRSRAADREQPYGRQGKAITNFQATLPPPQSDLAQELIKDPYNFDFLTLTEDAQERDLERGLLAHLRQFLIEFGVGFAFVGSQVPLEVGGEDFKLDLLFYHLKLRCFVVIDLKMGQFKPEHAGKHLVEKLPELKGTLPTIEEIEAELAR